MLATAANVSVNLEFHIRFDMTLNEMKIFAANFSSLVEIKQKWIESRLKVKESFQFINN